MPALSLLSDADLLTRLPELVLVECEAMADVIEHLVEVERRQLFLEQACSSLTKYCEERLGYAEDAAFKRARVAKLALQFPRALDELRSGEIHLTGLLQLAPHLTADNADQLFTEARGKPRRELALILARRFPRPDVPSRIQTLGASPSGNGAGPRRGTASGPSSPNLRSGAEPFRLEPLSAERYRIEFTASSEFRAKLEQARELLSHAVPSGDIAVVLERALDELIARELKRRTGAGKPRKRRELQPGSRHIPVEVERAVRERDGGQCTFHDAAGRRCSERRFLTIEHRDPFARGGPPTVENLCLFCSSHNAYTARQVFGAAFIAKKRAARSRAKHEPVSQSDAFDKVLVALCHNGFSKREAKPVVDALRHEGAAPELVPLLRTALDRLTPTRA